MSQKGFINILLVVVIVALAGIGVYFFTTRQTTPPIPVSTLTTTPSPTPTPTLTPKSSPTPKPSPTPTPTPTSTNSPVVSSSSNFSDIVSVVENKLPIWINLWRQAIPGFKVSSFRKISEETIKPDVEYPYSPSQQSKLREIIYAYSPDKTKFVDTRGGMELYEENGKLKAAFDIDSDVGLIDLKSNKYNRLLFCGTPCGFDDAIWIDNNIFVVVGQTEYYPANGEERCTVNTKCTWVATLHVFDLTKNIVTLYYGPEIDKGVGGYLRAKFPNIVFD